MRTATGPIRGPVVYFAKPLRLGRAEAVDALAVAAQQAKDYAETQGRTLTGAEALAAARNSNPGLFAAATTTPADGSAPGRLLAAMAARPGLTGAEALDALRESDPELYREATAGYGLRAER